MCVTCFTLWFCTSTLCTVLTTNHLLMGFSEHLSVVSDRGCHPSPVKKTSNEASGRVGILFFFSFSHVCVCSMHVYICIFCTCVGTYVWVHMHMSMQTCESPCLMSGVILHHSSSLFIKAGLSVKPRAGQHG